MECNPTPKNLLDQAIDNYDTLACKYFDQKNSLDKAPQDVRDARQKELKVIQEHLENQRVNAMVLADIQTKLDAYQEEGRQATVGTRSEVQKKQAALLAERHHPTQNLEGMLKAACRPKPSQRHSAHHIVLGKGRIARTNQVRVRMHIQGIRINDPDNGVWLPMTKADTPNWAMPDSMAHKQYHTNEYEEKVAERIFMSRNEQQIRMQLRLIGKALEQNKFPYKRRA
ncbi:MAG: AHH domain-containing protein [Cellvibrionaceae bacterium]